MHPKSAAFVTPVDQSRPATVQWWMVYGVSHTLHPGRRMRHLLTPGLLHVCVCGGCFTCYPQFIAYNQCKYMPACENLRTPP
ncbi:hypothetical protein BDW74DRAFT_146334 [Aspergillus multicolor]|uniref:uncharacterized protein n=1 Tax=Aspergillus multicolor TaxID=41759 RepID=UPI003CCDD579